MRPALELTSVPGWAVASTRPPADLTGRYWTVVGFGDEAGTVLKLWTDQIAAHRPDATPDVHSFGVDSLDVAVEAVTAAIKTAVVGWRLMLAGPAYACLKVRAHALRLGVADAEIVVASTEVDTREVICVHCDNRNAVRVDLEDTSPCTGCGRNLFVHYHVSRLTGAHLGYMADAEQLPVAAS
jgi:hypothetical protein